MKSGIHSLFIINERKNRKLLFALCVAQALSLCACSLKDPSGKQESTDAASVTESIQTDSDSDVSSKTPTPVTPPTAISDVPMTIVNENVVQAADEQEVLANTCGDLSVPTYVNKVDDLYFIVDCYHNQVIYHDNLSDPIWQWNVLPGDLSMAHTIASDGTVYLVDDTENHRVVVYERYEDKFVVTQAFDHVGTRPHFIQYNESDQTFYAWSSITGEMFLFKVDSTASDEAGMYHPVYLSEVRKIDALDGVYVRSFTLDGDEIYFVSGNENSKIIRAKLSDFSIIEEYPVPAELAGMIQLTKLGSLYYLTVSTDVTGNQDFATIVRTKDLGKLIQGDYEDIYELFVGGGTPYYISEIDGTFYMTEHRIPGHSVWSFRVEKDNVVDVTAVY